MPVQLLFVYGILRPAFGRPMALWFGTVARHKGKGSAKGALYRIADYPGFVPGPNGVVAGDVFELLDPTPVLAKLDIYEECSPDFPPPHEYRREMLAVDMPDGPVQAWVYARPTGWSAWKTATCPPDMLASGRSLASLRSGAGTEESMP